MDIICGDQGDQVKVQTLYCSKAESRYTVNK